MESLCGLAFERAVRESSAAFGSLPSHGKEIITCIQMRL